MRSFLSSNISRMRTDTVIHVELSDMSEDFARAKSLLIGAVDMVLSLERRQETLSCTSSHLSGLAPQQPCSSTQLPPVPVDLHSVKVLVLKNTSVSLVFDRRKGRYLRKGDTRVPPPGRKTVFVCGTRIRPGSLRIELARMGLGLTLVIFSSDGDAEHIHQMLLQRFPLLEDCRGYTLLRLAENSHN